MSDPRSEEESRKKCDKLFIGGILFGISIMISFFFTIRFAFEIELTKNNFTYPDSIFLWMIELMIILIGIGCPWIIWRIFVKPFK